MVGTIGLHMGIVLIQSKPRTERHRFILPTGRRVVLPPFGSARIERNTVDGDPARDSRTCIRAVNNQLMYSMKPWSRESIRSWNNELVGQAA
jgi:hypothetical protein